MLQISRKLENIFRYLDGFISPIDKMIDSQKLFYLPKCIYFLLCALLGDKQWQIIIRGTQMLLSYRGVPLQIERQIDNNELRYFILQRGCFKSVQGCLRYFFFSPSKMLKETMHEREHKESSTFLHAVNPSLFLL